RPAPGPPPTPGCRTARHKPPTWRRRRPPSGGRGSATRPPRGSAGPRRPHPGCLRGWALRASKPRGGRGARRTPRGAGGLSPPGMSYTGWPIHRTGWLALGHRSADMNSLITLGTVAAYGYSLLVTVAPGLFPVDVQGVYFEAVGVILTLILLGRLIETKAK